ncbi:MAG: hypothetical protein ACXABF_13620 [Candidatus Thorarchaeota archaeon]|jgi:hypothetical protein
MKKTHTLVIIAVLLVSVAATASFASAQTGADPYVRVIWEEVDEFEEFENSRENTQWVFGPQPGVWIGYSDNLTSIEENHFQVQVGTELLINVTLPKSWLGEGNELDTVQFWGTTYRPRSPLFVLQYNATEDHWEQVNLHYQPGSQDPSSGNFLELKTAECEYEETSDYYQVVFVVEFMEEVVEDTFWTGMQAIDTIGRPVSPSWLARLNSGNFATPPIGLGVPVHPRDFSLPDYYYGDIVNPDGDVVHYVGENDTFIVRLQSNALFGEVILPFALLTWDPDYVQPVNISMPIGDIEEGMWNRDVVWVNTTMNYGPVLYMIHNSTGTFIVTGYPELSWSWTSLDEGIGLWLPRFDVKENTTIDLSKYFVVNDTLTDLFDSGHRVQWSGYFTNNTDMDPGPDFGATINPEMSLALVNDIYGDPIAPRPEIVDKQTMKLAFKDSFAEAFIFDVDGNIADAASQGDTLNLTMLVHVPEEKINGTVYYDVHGINFYVETLLVNLSLQFDGDGSGSNETHYWRVIVSYDLFLDLETKTAVPTTTYDIWIYERWTNHLVQEAEVRVSSWTIDEFELEIGEELTVLKVIFSFNPEAPSMVLDRSKIEVGVIQNTRSQYPVNDTWMGPWWLLGDLPNYWSNYSLWIDQYQSNDISGDTLWSPRHLRLGDVDKWTPPIWTVTDDGAIDLDGNTYTTGDQYFVKRTGYWEDSGNITVEGMTVVVGFDPSPATAGDEFVSWSWMGIAQLNMEFEANETFYWYHASDRTPLTASEISDIQEIMWANQSTRDSIPGYEWVAWLSENRTLNLGAETGLEEGKWSNTWFAWGTQQAFQVATTEASTTVASFRAKYAGLLLYNDVLEGGAESAPDFAFENGQLVTEEVTHLVLIDSIGSMELRKPFESTEATGDEVVTPDTLVEFGISIYDVDVTIYPLRIQNSTGVRGAWDFRQSYEGAIGLDSTDFDYWITSATVDEMSFDIAFSVDLVEYDATDSTTWNHAASFKIDQVFGEWTLHDFDKAVLEGRGLAVNFFGVLGTVTRTQYQAGDTAVADTNTDSVEADYYEFGTANNPFAEVTMGDLPYTSGLDGHSTIHRSGSSTAPIGAFSLMYESAAGDTVTDWNVDASMLFMTAGYNNWGGHEIICDPVFVAYTSAMQTGAPTTGGDPYGLYIMVGVAVVVVIVILVYVRRRN